MNIAVVGGSGFIGNFLIEELLSAGHRVVNFDIQHPKNPRVTHVYVDVTNFSKLTIAMASQWDAIYLMAAVANVELSPEEATAIVTGVFTLVNVVMRLVTKAPAHVFKKAEGEKAG